MSENAEIAKAEQAVWERAIEITKGLMHTEAQIEEAPNRLDQDIGVENVITALEAARTSDKETNEPVI